MKNTVQTLKVNFVKYKQLIKENNYLILLENNFKQINNQDLIIIKVKETDSYNYFVVLKNKKNLNYEDIALIIDEGRLKYGFYYLNNKIIIPKIDYKDGHF